MKKYFAKMTIGVGISSCEIIEGVDKQDAEDLARSLCIDLADSYGFQQDEDFYAESDTVGRGWNDETEEYEEEGFLEYFVEEYNPEEHDSEIC